MILEEPLLNRYSDQHDGPDAGGVEDPRIVKFDDEYYVTYAFRPYPPGQLLEVSA